MSLIRASLRISSRCLTSSFSRSISTSSRLLSDVPAADGAEKPSPKVEKLVSEIMELSLFESISLSKALQKAMGLDGVPMSFGAPAAAAPAAAAPAAAAAAKPAEEKKEEVAAKTSFSVRLDSFDQKDKIKVIKEIRTATGLGLKESKELVESVPKVFKKDLKKDEADALVAKLKEAGAKCSLEQMHSFSS